MKKLIALILSCACILSLTACGQTKLSPDDIAQVTFEGYDGFGEAVVNANNDVNKLIDPQKVVKYVNKVENADWLFSTETLNEQGINALLVYSLDKTTELSNGDTVTLTVEPCAEMTLVGQSLEDIEKGVGFQLPELSTEIEVTGLEEINKIDISKELTAAIQFKGIDGDAVPEFDPEKFQVTKDGFEFYGVEDTKNRFNCFPDGERTNAMDMSINFTPYENLKTGDTCTVTINYNQDAALESGFALTREFDITVPELAEYITTPDQITDKMKTDAIEYIFNAIKSDSWHSFYNTFNLQSAQWGDRKKNAPVGDADEEHYLALKYEYTYTTFDTYRDQEYAICSILLYPDGTYEFGDVKFGSLSDQYNWTDLNWDLSSYNE